MISDVHGNLEALDAVIGDMAKNYHPSFLEDKDSKLDLLGNLGDLVGYMVNPNEVVKKVTDIADFNLPGNHDISVNVNDYINYNSNAKWALQWTSKNINETTRKKLEQICENPNLNIKIDGAIFAHSTPYRPAAMNYVGNRIDAAEGFFQHAKFDGLHGFVGHRHVPQFYYAPKVSSDLKNISEIYLDFDRTFSRQSRNINLMGMKSSLTVIPSVGQPRDGNPLSGYAIYYPGQKKIEVVRVPYDLETTQNKMRKLLFPEYLVERLELGR